MTKMEGIAAEVSQKLKSAIRAKLMELGAYVDDELSNYVMVMVTNRRSKAEMDRELQLFLGTNTSAFTTWLQSVWQKLEQVTVANSGDGKRKTTDKKKKTKKSSKSSSESEDEKKHKKKRKSSSTDIVSKDTKKRKLTSKESDSGKSFHKKKGDHDEANSDSDDVDESSKKSLKDEGGESCNEEEDFLNIKEDFESEFLSDNELSESIEKSKPSVTHDAKKSQKPNSESKVISLKRIKDNVPKTVDHKENSDKTKSNTDTNVSKGANSEANKETKPLSSRKPLVRDYKARSPSKLKNRHRSRSCSKSRSRSNSPAPSKIIQLRRTAPKPTSEEEDDLNTKLQRSRLRSIAASSNTVIISTKSRSRSRSPLISAAAKKLRAQEGPQNVLDARELINKKRAMCMANEPATKEKNELGSGKTVGGGNIIRIRDRERSKENLRIDGEDSITVDDDWPENGSQTDENNKQILKLTRNNGRKFLINRTDGKRSVIVQSLTNAKSPPPSSRRVDLRSIKRTVFVNEDDTNCVENDVDDDDDVEVETTTNLVDDECAKKKSIMDRISKYITPEKSVASTVVKLPKPSRPKTSPAQSASSTLIRKAVADAHKSLTNSKDDSTKKKEALNVQVGRDRLRENNTTQAEVSDNENLPNENVSENEDEDNLSTKSTKSSDDHTDNYHENEDMDEGVELDHATEEYEPTMNMPQFVVTLTGLDSKLFPKDDTDDMNSFNDDLEPDLADREEKNKTKPNQQERCKYYPNCLAGDQCLFYHPTIPCKMFPNCKFGNNCLYIHPKCKFDSMCTRYDCTFMHTTPRVAPPVPPRHAAPTAMMTAQPCKFYYNCVNPVCPFQHPKICRFDRFCTNKNCTFQHTSLSHVSMVSKDKLKWSRPKDADSKIEMENEVNFQ